MLFFAMMLTTARVAFASDSVGGQLRENDLILHFFRDNMSFFLSFDAELRDGTVLSVVNEKGDAVPDGKGPKGNANPLISAVENPISLEKRDYKAVYHRSDDTYSLTPLTEDYYTFLGWQYDYSSVDGVVNSPVVTDISSVEKNTVIEGGSVGSRHYTAFWRQNLLNILYNSGKDYKGNYAVNKGNGAYEIGSDGLIVKDGDVKFASAGSEQKTVTEYVDRAASLNMSLPDYHLDAGKEWVDADGNTFGQGKTYFSTDIAPSLKDGDCDVVLTANWIPNVYTISYDFGTVNSVIADKTVYMPSFTADTKNSDGYEASSVKGSYNKWGSEQKFTYETVGELPGAHLDDYVFAGWFVGDVQVRTWDDIKSVTESNRRDIKVVAKWESVSYDIKYDLDKEDLPEKLTVPVTEVAPVMMGYDIKGGHNAYNVLEESTVENTGVLPVPSRKYYDFEGWYLGDTKVTTYKDIYDNTKKRERSCTLAAKWSPVVYKITYSEKGNRPGMVNAVVNDNLREFSVETVNDEKNILSDASCDGYKFVRFLYNDELDAVEFKKISELPFRDVDVTIEWEILEYHISFDTQELSDEEWGWTDTTEEELLASMVKANESHLIYNAEETFAIVNPSLQHNSFSGWTGSRRGSSITIPKGTTGDISLTCNWKQSHTYLNYVVDSKASCTSNGSKHRDCKYCGAHGRQNTVISARGHSYSSKVTKDSTCTAEGNRHYTCTHTSSTEYVSCNHSYDAPIAKKAHTYTWVTTKAATCTATGSKVYKCSACGDVSPPSRLLLPCFSSFPFFAVSLLLPSDVSPLQALFSSFLPFFSLLQSRCHHHVRQKAYPRHHQTPHPLHTKHHPQPL